MRYSDKGRKFYTISDTLTGKMVNIEMKKTNTDKHTNKNNRTKPKSMQEKLVYCCTYLENL
jgi:hypothetical protein